MSSREALEAALLARWERDTLAVYGDQLQADGDPRGELIAVDFEREQCGATPESDARRRALIRDWLGVDLDEARYALARFGFGFIEHLELDEPDPYTARYLLERALERCGGYLRSIHLGGTRAEVLADVSLLARRTRPWLERLSLHVSELDGEGPAIDEGTARQLLAALPNLRALELAGARVLDRFAHPGLQRIRALPVDSLAALARGEAMPSVVELELLLPDVSGALGARRIADAVPSIEHLRLGRNTDWPAVVQLARTFERAPHLRRLELPALMNDADVRLAQDMLDRLPRLTEIRVARAYAMAGQLGGNLRHPSGPVALPSVASWRPPASYGSSTLEVFHGVRRVAENLPLRELAGLMDDQCAGVSAPAREAWDELWLWLSLALIEVDGDPEYFSTAVLRRALESLVLDGDHAGWQALRAELRSAGLPPMLLLRAWL